MEGHTYLCSWKKLRGTFHLSVPSLPGLRAEAKDFLEASEALSQAICTRTGDGEAILEFDPLPPKEATLRVWARPEIFVLGYNEHVSSNLLEPGMYSGARCPKCGFSRGRRTNIPIVLKDHPKADIFRAAESRPPVLLCSQKVADLLVSRLKADGLRLGAATTEGKSKKRYFEIGGEPIIPLVTFRDAVYNPITNWRCTVCHRRSLYPSHRRLWGTEIQYFVSFADLPTPLPEIFVAGSREDGIQICITGALIGELRRHSIKGLITSPLGIVHPPDLRRDPPPFGDYPSSSSQ
jgi:hypothetical protein